MTIMEMVSLKCDWCGLRESFSNWQVIEGSGWFTLQVETIRSKESVIDWHVCGKCTTRIVPILPEES